MCSFCLLCSKYNNNHWNCRCPEGKEYLRFINETKEAQNFIIKFVILYRSENEIDLDFYVKSTSLGLGSTFRLKNCERCEINEWSCRLKVLLTVRDQIEERVQYECTNVCVDQLKTVLYQQTLYFILFHW